MKLILWNRRPSDTDHVGDIDEIVLDAKWVHVEQMSDNSFWIGIDLAGGGHWSGNFDSRSEIVFSEQEQEGFEWDQDDTHEET